MERTDGMEYQLTKICKTHHHGCGKVVNAVSPLLASTISQFAKQPHYQEHKLTTQNHAPGLLSPCGNQGKLRSYPPAHTHH